MEPVGCHELESSLSLVNYALTAYKPRSTADPARTLNCFPLDWKINPFVKNVRVCFRSASNHRGVLRDFVPHAGQSQSNLCFCIYLKSFKVAFLLLKVTVAVCLSRFWAFLPIIQQPVQQIGFLSGLEVCIWREISLYRYQALPFVEGSVLRSLKNTDTHKKKAHAHMQGHFLFYWMRLNIIQRLD